MHIICVLKSLAAFIEILFISHWLSLNLTVNGIIYLLIFTAFNFIQ